MTSRLKVLALASLCSACSATFMTPPPASAGSGLARPQLGCTSSYWAPVVDSVLAGYEIASVAYVATLDDSRFANYPISRKEDMALGGAFGAVFVGSAIYGYVQATRCRRMQRGPATPQYLPGVSSNPSGLSPSQHLRKQAGPDLN